LAELLIELREFLAEPQEADFLVDIRILKLGANVVEHGSAAAVTEIAVVLGRAFRRSA
jgi:hypothetical protein